MKIKLLRISKHITQKELAKMVGVSHVTIARIEKDMIDQIRVGTLKKVAEALDTTVKELFFEENENKPWIKTLKLQTKIERDNKEEF